MRVVAAAGTGKTAIIAERFRRLVAAGAPPSRILVMTFTERAASEMRARIEQVGIEEAPSVGTFHSLAQRWLQDEGSRIGVGRGFRILSGAERWISLRELMWELGSEALLAEERPDDLVAPLLKMQERLKQELIGVERLRAWAEHSEMKEKAGYFMAAADLFEEHARRCRRDRLLDFDDLIFEAVRLLESSPEAADLVRGRFGWIMVDEYQDTNLAQERLVELLGLRHRNVFVVGDDDQSIYRFRGASRASMERFLKVFPGASSLSLGRNRRSSGRIVAAAAALIEHNQDRLPKVLSASARAGAPIRLWHCGDAAAEAATIAAEVGRLIAAGTDPSRIAVLSRTNAIAQPIAAELGAAGIPHHHRGAQGFYQRAEVKDVLALLRTLADPADPADLVALARAAASPPAGLDLTPLLAWVRAGSGPELTALDSLLEWPPAAAWASLMLDLRAEKESLGIGELFFELMARSRYLEVAAAAEPAEAGRTQANLARFGELIDGWCERAPDQSLAAFLAHLELVLLSGVDEETAEPESAGEPAVQVMTIHQAKGLEFDAVFLPALVEGRLPQPRRQDRFELPPQLLEPAVRAREDQLAEERRLCYVAMTRARTELHLSWAERYEGGRAWRRSRFVDEIAERSRLAPESVPARGEPVPAAAPAPPPSTAGVSPARLSFSAISSYRECPRQYSYRYQHRLPQLPTAEAEFGTLMHLVLMEAGRRRQASRPLDEASIEAVYLEAWAGVALPDRRRRPALERIGRAQLGRFLAAGGLERRPSHVEQSFTSELDGWHLTGIIDRIDPPPPTPEGGGVGPPGPSGAVGSTAQEMPPAWRIVDYKTGSPLPAGRLRRDLQLLLYALGAKAALGLDPVELEIFYLKDGRSVVLRPDPEQLQEAEAIGAGVAAGIAAGRVEPRPERRRCRLCSYRLLCDAAL